MTSNGSPIAKRWRLRRRHCAAFVGIGLLAIVLSRCGAFVYDRPIIGSYRLIAVDTLDQLTVADCFSDGACQGKIPPTVFAVGHDDRHIVAKVNLGTREEPYVRYFFIDMSADRRGLNSSDIAIGPLTEEEFERQRAALTLPDFSGTIREVMPHEHDPRSDDP